MIRRTGLQVAGSDQGMPSSAANGRNHVAGRAQRHGGQTLGRHPPLESSQRGSFRQALIGSPSFRTWTRRQEAAAGLSFWALSPSEGMTGSPSSFGRQRLVWLDAIFSLSGLAPRTAAKGDGHLDGLKESSEAVAHPRPSANGATMLAELGVKQARLFFFVGHGHSSHVTPDPRSKPLPFWCYSFAGHSVRTLVTPILPSADIFTIPLACGQHLYSHCENQGPQVLRVSWDCRDATTLRTQLQRCNLPVGPACRPHQPYLSI